MFSNLNDSVVLRVKLFVYTCVCVCMDVRARLQRLPP